MSTLTQFLGGKPRRQVVTLTASNASLPIPAWAQGGKGIVYVTGCGGGGSGQVSVTGGNRGLGGGAGGQAVQHPIVIPSGHSTCNVSIGLGGSAVSAASQTNGNSGGATTLTIGSIVLRLEGGGGGGLSAAGSQGLAYFGAALPAIINNANQVAGFGSFLLGGTTQNARSLVGRGLAGASTLIQGATSAATDINGHHGAGGQSLFGAGGAGLGSVGGSTTNGADGTGYGAGGAGALWVSGGNAVSGAGAPGLLILEFVEGL